MTITRRELMKHLGAAGALGALGGWSGLAQAARRPRLIPWRNWSGAQQCLPAARLAPDSEAAMADAIRKAQGVIRPVGASHSFSALVPTDGTMIALGNMSGLISHDAASLQAEFWAGTPMSQMGDALKQVGQGLPNMSDINYQTLAGAISTSTHGTGPKYGSYSSYVTGLRLVTASGEILDCDAKNNPEIFRAARVSMGALGVITRVRLQNRKAYRLHEKVWIGKTEELLEDMERLVRENDHFEINSILHADVSVATALNETTDPQTKPKEGGGDGDKVDLLRKVNTYARKHPGVQATLLNNFIKHIDFPEVIDDSHKVYANVRDQRFNEMEYSVPAAVGPACMREVLKTIRDQNLNSFFPVEYRYIKGDDIPLSMFEGGERCAISVHQSYEMSYHDFFAQIEPIFWKYDGRPHWGKLHTLNAAQLSKLYPRWKEFTDLRQALDPKGRFLNGHLRSVFGVN